MTTLLLGFMGLLALLLSVSCQSHDSDLNARSQEFTPPPPPSTARLVLEPLHPRHVKLDYAALMGSRDHLQTTLRWNDWPREDFKVEDNKKDLERHWREFEDREAYAYTVLAPDRSSCLGCIYLNPEAESPRKALLAYWVVKDRLSTGLDEYLLSTVMDWVRTSWPLDEVVIYQHLDNTRGAKILKKAGVEVSESEGKSVYRWRP